MGRFRRLTIGKEGSGKGSVAMALDRFLAVRLASFGLEVRLEAPRVSWSAVEEGLEVGVLRRGPGQGRLG